MGTIFKFLMCIALASIILPWQIPTNIGIFESSGDIGNAYRSGELKFNPIDSTYVITGGGGNMWFETDEFYFVWKTMSGDVSLTADIDWLRKGANPHRKACLIFRQSLDPGSAYADIAVHGDGLTSLQYRESLGASTHEVQANSLAPSRLRIEKIGKYVSMSMANKDESLPSSGASIELMFKDPFYVGLGVCAHDNKLLETAKFSNVEIKTLMPKQDSLKSIQSTLETISISDLNRKVIYHTEGHIEAPNWSPDGKTLVYNSDGLLYKIPVAGGIPKLIPTDFANRINNDHGISPDGEQLVISDQTETGQSMIYSLPIGGGIPKKITALGPSYWHGWSPDGSTLAYCAERNGNYDIYTIPFEGGQEKRLTTTAGLDDGPDYSPDGNYIYFNSARTGTMQIWRMKTNGEEQEQLTTDKNNDWFAHPSPDGKWIVYITFDTAVAADQHPPNKNVMLRLMNLETNEIQLLAKLFGGQGTINVPSWSPDSQEIAFVSYQLK